MRRRRYVIVARKKRKRVTRRRPGRPRVITMKRLLGRGVSRPYKDNNRLMLGSKTKRWFFSVDGCSYCCTSSDRFVRKNNKVKCLHEIE